MRAETRCGPAPGSRRSSSASRASARAAALGWRWPRSTESAVITSSSTEGSQTAPRAEGGLHRAAQHRGPELGGAAALQGRLTGEELPQDQPDPVYVHPGVQVAQLRRLLGGEVPGLHGALLAAREAGVEEAGHAVVAHRHVGGADLAVEGGPPVQELQGSGDVQGDLQRGGHRPGGALPREEG
jgi:hypothetical protein